MRIWGEGSRITGILQKKKNINKLESISGTSRKKDVVSISGQGKDYQLALKSLKDIPDIRSEKIERILQSYESGNYAVKGEDIASKIFSSILDKKV